MSLAQVPIELLQEILAFALYGHDCPSAVLCANKTFYELGQPLVHTHLRFYSITQLHLFAAGQAPLICPPKSIVIALAGGAADFQVFRHLAGALRRCQKARSISNSVADDEPDGRDEQSAPSQLPLELLSLRLHSHSSNPHLSYIYEALSLANPREFVWKGPDPEHHFSTAIVPSATYHLIRAIGTWSAVQHITLTNMSFPSDELGRNTPFARDAPLLPPLPALKTIYIGQATLLPPGAVAAMVARGDGKGNAGALERVRLVDTYRHSIWGSRIRLRDVEDAVDGIRGLSVERKAEVVERVRRIVQCEKKTERIWGGDSGDKEGVLR